jgi:hypothetical protein
MEVGANREYPNPPSWYTATERYGQQTKLIKLDTGGYTINGYVTGIPFPRYELKQPEGAYKLFYNAYYHYFTSVGYFASSGFEIDHFLNQSWNRSYEVQSLLAHNSDPSFHLNSATMPGYFLAFYDELTAPEQSKYTTEVELLYDDPQKLPEAYVFLPSLRRALRLSSGARCSPFVGSDYTNDDVLNGLPSPPGLFAATRQADRKILVFMPTPEEIPKQYDRRNFYVPLGFFPKPSAGKWVIREVYVLDLERLPQFRKGYCFGLRRLFIDKDTYNVVGVDIYDSDQKFWKYMGFLQAPAPVPGGGYLHSLRGITWVIDFQNEHVSWGLVGDGEWALNNEVAASYRDEARYASPSGLVGIMR